MERLGPFREVRDPAHLRHDVLPGAQGEARVREEEDGAHPPAMGAHTGQGEGGSPPEDTDALPGGDIVHLDSGPGLAQRAI